MIVLTTSFPRVALSVAGTLQPVPKPSALLVVFALALAILCVCGSRPVFACADGPDYLRVTNVAADDVLNVRSGPGLKFGITGVLPPDAVNLKNLDQVPIFCDDPTRLTAFERANFWTKIAWQNDNNIVVGWVKSRFVSE